MKILIVGLGSIATKHIIAIRAINSNAKIYALRSGMGSITIDGIISLHSEEEIPLDLSFVIVSNPTHKHYEAIERLSALGVPLFIEKPPLHTIEKSETLIRLLDENQIITYIACNLRFHPCIEFLRGFLVENKCRINEVNVYCGSYLPDWRQGKDFRDFYSAKEALGGGVHLDLYHEIDYSVWLFGIPISNTGYRTSKSSLRIDSSDYANYLLNYSEFNLSIILNYYRRNPRRTIEIVLENSTLNIDLIANKIETESGEVIFETNHYNIMDTYIDQMKYFMECIRGELKPMNDINEAIAILKLCLKNEFVS